MSQCKKCSLWELSACNQMKGRGPRTADVMIVAEAPGAEEEIQNTPLVGQSGQLLNDCLLRVGLDRNKAYITNTVLCRPVLMKGNYRANRAPKASEIKACSEYLDKDISEIKPKLIVCLGAVAMHRLFGKGKEVLRGTFSYNEKYNTQVFYTYHPSAILRSPQLEGIFIKDLTTLAHYIKGEDKVEVPLKYQFVDSVDFIDEVIERLKQEDIVAYDFECTGLDPRKDQIGCVSFSWKDHTGVCIPLLDNTESPYWKDYKWFQKIFEDVLRDKLLICHNMNYERSFLISNNIADNVSKYYDTMLAHFILQEEGAHDLKTLAYLHTDMGMYAQPFYTYLKNNKLSSTDYIKVPYELLAPYNIADSDASLRLYRHFDPLITKEGLRFVFDELLIKFQPVLTMAEIGGVQINVDHLRTLRKRYQEEIAAIRASFKAKTQQYVDQVVVLKGKPKSGLEKEVNINSSKQLGRLLFDVLHLKSDKKTPGGAMSTDEEVLKKLESKHEIPALIMKCRSVQIDDNYMANIEERLDEFMRVHTNYKLFGEVTGRISSSDPNLQNPKKIKDVRDVFISKLGSSLLEADFAGQELRLGASESGDAVMLKAFLNNEDLHRRTASVIYKIPEDQVTEKQRALGKSLNFAIFYGATFKAVSELLLCSEDDAQKYIDSWFAAYPGVRIWINKVIQELYQNKYVTNMFGRRRRFPNIDMVRQFQAEEMERQAVNFKIQCIEENQMVLTNTGYVPIKDLTEDMRVFDGEGYVNFLLSEPRFKREYEIVVANGSSIKCSREHKFLVTNSRFERVWKKAEDIKVGDHLVGKIEEVSNINDFEFDYSYDDSHVDQVIPKRFYPEIRRIVSPNIAYLIGALIGDGSYTNFNDMAIACKPMDYHKILTDMFKCEFNIDAKSKGDGIILYSRILRDYFLKLGLGFVTYDNKDIPDWIFRAPLNLRQSLLRGLFDTDGTIGQYGSVVHCFLVSTSYSVIRKSHILLNSCGIDSKISILRKIGGNRQAYRVIIGHEYIQKFIETIGFLNPDKHQVSLNILQNKHFNKSCGYLPSNAKKFFGKYILSKYKKKRDYGDKDTYHLVHSMLTRFRNLGFGTKCSVGFISGSLIRHNDIIIKRFVDGCNYNYFKVKSIKKSDKQVRMYDISVLSKNKSYVCNGVIVHNSAGNDLACLSAILIDQRVKAEGLDAHMVLTVHDSLIYEVNDKDINSMGVIMKQVMERKLPNLKVDMTIDLKVGKAWGSMAAAQ